MSSSETVSDAAMSPPPTRPHMYTCSCGQTSVVGTALAWKDALGHSLYRSEPAVPGSLIIANCCVERDGPPTPLPSQQKIETCPDRLVMLWQATLE